MRNVYAKFERQKIGRSKSKLDAIHRQHTVHMAYDLHGSKSHKHASRRSNILKNFHSYICTELLVEGYSVQRNNAASISAACDMPSVCTKQATPFSWVSCKRTKARALESLPSIKKYMRSDLKTSPELMVVNRIGRKVHQLPSELLRKPALTSPDHISSGLQNHGTRVQLSSRILISPHCWWTLPSHPRSSSHNREAHSLNLTQRKQNKLAPTSNVFFRLFLEFAKSVYLFIILEYLNLDHWW